MCSFRFNQIHLAAPRKVGRSPGKKESLNLNLKAPEHHFGFGTDNKKKKSQLTCPLFRANTPPDWVNRQEVWLQRPHILDTDRSALW